MENKMNNLTLKVRQNPGVIELNFNELEQAIDTTLAEYEGAVFTEETKDIAKGEIASLRKRKQELDDLRKTVKREWMKPYDDFEKRVKVLLAKFDDPINLIDKQVKEFDENRRVEKRKAIKGMYDELIGSMGEYVPLDVIYDRKWENVSVSMKSIRESISSFISSAQTAVNSIKAMSSEKEQDALDTYKKTQDLAKAMTVITEYERQKAEILKREEERRRAEEDRQRQAEIDRARAAEREAARREEAIRRETAAAQKEAETVMPATEVINPFQQQDNDDDLPFAQPTTITAFYKVVATSQELEQVEMAFNSIGIWFERRDA